MVRYYYQCVEELGGCPRQLRTDPGTENGVMAGVQCYLRANGTDNLAGENAHCYGASTANERIECWWSHLRCSRTSWWINFFKELRDDGVLICGRILHDECLWFCFCDIQQDLDFARMHWNTHRILLPTFDTVPGKPDELFFLAEEYGGVDQLQPVSNTKIEELQSPCDNSVVQSEYQDYFEYVLELNGLSKPTNWSDALSLFKYLVQVAG